MKTETKPTAKAEVKAATPAQLQVNQIITKMQLDQLQTHVADLKTSYLETGEKYLSLCKYVRMEKIPPTVVRETMMKEGFTKQRITEINRVAQCADELWDAFEARQLAFKQVLQIERGSFSDVRPENVGNAPELQGDGANEDGSKEELTLEEKKEKAQQRILTAAKGILRAAADLELRAKKWTIDNGYLLTLTKVKAKAKNQHTAKGEEEPAN